MRRREFIVGAAALVASACTDSEPLADAESTGTAPASSAEPTSATTATTASSTVRTAPGPAVVQAQPVPDPGIALASPAFGLGVASGDPDANGMVLWTKIIPADPGQSEVAAVPLAYDIAIDEDFASIIESGVVDAKIDDALTVRIVVMDLIPNTQFWYRFRVGDQTSPAGRTRTMPASGEVVDRFGLAVSSCQSRAQPDLWDAHLDLANDDSIDLVLWLGDFIYERRTTTTLADYRALYDAHRGDQRLQASSAAHPWFVTMDDHEVRNDYTAAVDSDRRAAAYQAWWEHMPTRLPRPDSDGMAVYRSLDVGDLARILVLDCRQYAQVSPAPDATVLGADQLGWLEQVTQHGGIHTILGSPVLVSSLEIDDVLLPYAFEAHPPDQQRVVGAMVAAPGPVIVSGDLHVAMELEAAPGLKEWMAPPLSSMFPDRFAPFLPLLPLVSPAVVSARDSHGYLRVDLTPTSATPHFPL